ncbi:MAG: serine hydrolase [bacterium]|nr:serine hydrolase [bacterium]
MSNPVAASTVRPFCIGNKCLWGLLFGLALLVGACGNDDNTHSAAATATATQLATGEVASEITGEITGTPGLATPTSAGKPTSTPTTEPAVTPVATPTAQQLAEPTAQPTTASPTPDTQTTQPDGDNSAARASGLDVGAIGAATQDWMMSAGAPGLVLSIARGAAEPHTFSWGVSDLKTQEPLSVTDYVRIGSVTKPVTTVAIMSLVEEGAVSLDTPVTEYLGDSWYDTYENGAKITLRHLMGHTAGFVEYAFDPGFFVLGASRLDVQITPEEIVRFFTAYGPVTEFESEYNYSTAGHVVAGMVIEAVTGNPADEEIRSRIFQPLGLENIYLPPNEQPPQQVVNSYNGGLLYGAFSALTNVPDEAQAEYLGNRYIATNSYPQQFLQSAGWTGGGIEAQIGDVSKLFRGLFAGDLISEESLAEMTTTGVNPTYGLGVDVENTDGILAYSHGGAIPGFRTRAIYIPEWDITVAATTNVLPTDPELLELLRNLIDIVAQNWGLAS